MAAAAADPAGAGSDSAAGDGIPAEYEADFDMVQSNVLKLAQGFAVAKAESAQLKSVLEATSRDLGDALALNEQLQREYEVLMQARDAVQAELQQKASDLRRAEDEVARLSAVNTATQADLAQARQEVSRLQTRVAELEAKSADSARLVQERDHQLATVVETMKEWKRNFLQLKQEIQTLRAARQKDQAEAQALRRENEQLRQQLHEMGVEMDDAPIGDEGGSPLGGTAGAWGSEQS